VGVSAPPPPQANHLHGNWSGCDTCEALRPPSIPAEEWNRVVAGPTPFGIQLWCMRCDANVAHVLVRKGGVVSAVTARLPSKDAPRILNEHARPIEASPEEVGQVVEELSDAAALLKTIPFGAVRVAISSRPVLKPLLPVVLAAEAFAARVRAYEVEERKFVKLTKTRAEPRLDCTVLESPRACTRCDGTGHVPDEDHGSPLCPDCGGNGVVVP